MNNFDLPGNMTKRLVYKRKRITFLIILLTVWTIHGNSQVSGYFLEWNGQKVALSSVSGLDGTTQTTLLRSRILSSPNSLSTGAIKTVTLQNLQCVPDNELYTWFCSFSQTTRQKKDVRIKLTNINGETIKAWRIYQATPLKMSVPPPLDANANIIAIESVVLTYEKIEPDW